MNARHKHEYDDKPGTKKERSSSKDLGELIAQSQHNKRTNQLTNSRSYFSECVCYDASLFASATLSLLS